MSFAAFEFQQRPAAGQGIRNQGAKLPRPRARVEQAVAHEADQIFELGLGQRDRACQHGIDEGQHGLDGAEPSADPCSRRRAGRRSACRCDASR